MFLGKLGQCSSILGEPVGSFRVKNDVNHNFIECNKQQEVQLFSSYKIDACFQLWRPVRKHTRAAALSLAASPCFGSDLKAPSGQKMSIYHVIFRILQERTSSNKYLIPKWRNCRSYTIYLISSSFPCSDPPSHRTPLAAGAMTSYSPLAFPDPEAPAPEKAEAPKSWSFRALEGSDAAPKTENGFVSCVSLKTWVWGKSWEKSWSKPHVDHVCVPRQFFPRNKWEEFDDEKPMTTSKTWNIMGMQPTNISRMPRLRIPPSWSFILSSLVVATGLAQWLSRWFLPAQATQEKTMENLTPRKRHYHYPLRLEGKTHDDTM